MIKKVLAFAGLLGMGVLGLWWLERNDGVQIDLAGEKADERPTETPTGASAVMMWGAQEFATYAEDGIESRFRAQDSRVTGPNEQALIDVLIEIFEPESGAPKRIATVNADRALITLDDIPDEIIPRPSDRVRLEDVVVDVRAGTRFAPLRLEAPTLLANLAEQRFVTDDVVTATSNEIDLEGIGCEFDMRRGRLVFGRDGEATVRAGDGRVARLWSRGALEVERPPGVGTRPVRVAANERARLGLSGDDGLALEADFVELVGSGDPEREGTFRFTGLTARGEVELHARGNRFRCRRATFTMTTLGGIESVQLAGAIFGELDPATTEIEGLDEAALVRGTSRRVELWGQGPMDLRLGANSGFELAGPAELAWGGSRLWAEGGLRGATGSEREPLSFEAWSGVRVQRDGWTVTTEELTGRFAARGEGEPTSIALETGVQALATGSDREGREVRLRAADGFALEIGEQTWIVRRAEGVDLSTGGSRPLTATADRIVDFSMDNVRGPSFEALDHVEVIANGQVLRGQHLIVAGHDDLTVSSDDGPVLLTGTGLEVQAEVVRRFVTYRESSDGSAVPEEHLLATGGASAHVQRRGSIIDLAANSIEIIGSIDAPAEEPLRLLARGAVDASVIQRGGAARLEIETDDLEIVRQPVRRGELVQTVVRARGGVIARVDGELGDHDLVSDELEALVIGAPFVVAGEDGELEIDDAEDDRAASDTEQERRGSLEALGNVRITSNAPTPLSGTGDSFSVDHEGRGVLIADPGNRVVAQGVLPASGQPFDVVCSSIEFDSTSLHIVEPRIEVGDPFAAARQLENEDGTRRLPVIVELVATCRRLDANEASVVFTGDVSFLGTTRTLETWTLRCARAELMSEVVQVENELGEIVDERQPRELVARGDVRAIFSEGLEAEGDRLVARAFEQRVRIEGDPARVRERGLNFNAADFEIDLVTLAVRVGKGTIRPSGGGN